MPILVWDKPGDRVYETGLDRGVLYLPDGTAVPWNGLTSIIEHFNRETSPVYYDGMKINDLVVLGDFSASMKAVTYPDEFVELEGIVAVKQGLFYTDQPPQTFGLCYRTQVGNDFEGEASAYKIHILYNVIAVPSDKTYASLTPEPNLVEFEWSITAIPEEIPGFRPTAHIIIDTRTIDPELLVELEALLYGDTVANGALIPMSDLVLMIQNWARVTITDNGDGTWTATTDKADFLFVDEEEQSFLIIGIDAVYLDEETYVISTTDNIADVPQIEITDNGNGTWTAETDHDSLFIDLGGGEVEIRNANISIVDATTYNITDTVSEL